MLSLILQINTYCNNHVVESIIERFVGHLSFNICLILISGLGIPCMAKELVIHKFGKEIFFFFFFGKEPKVSLLMKNYVILIYATKDTLNYVNDTHELAQEILLSKAKLCWC